MKRVLAAVLVCVMGVTAAVAAKPKPNPADYTLTVHVVSSGTGFGGTGLNAYTYQVLEVSVAGKPSQLVRFGDGILALGDYKAKIATSVKLPKNASSNDVYPAYDLLMPDGTSRTYSVSRLGPPASAANR